MIKNSSFFKILSFDKKSKARIGGIKTPHGKILTPAFVPVGSQATVKSLTPKDLGEIGTQVFFVNTYHLYLRPGAEVIEKLGGLHKFMSWNKPLMTDSGGFQVFSLNKNGSCPAFSPKNTHKGNPSWGSPYACHPSKRINESLVKIDYNGVTFSSHLDGSKHYFTPEKSIEVQQKLGADMMMAFDECAPYPTTHEYAEMAMKRTHRWAKRCWDYYHTTVCGNSRGRQKLFGVIQGSVYKDLREKSTKFISNLLFDGIAIGGVAVGETKKEMIQVLDWVTPILLKEKNQRPIHLLGVGEIDDILNAVERGVDLMDCVMPTRLGRMGHILIKQNVRRETRNEKFTIDITKSIFADDPKPLDDNCQCYVCRNFSRAYINHLFRARELLAYRLATYHNLYFMEQLFAKIREAIKNNEFLELKKQWQK